MIPSSGYGTFSYDITAELKSHTSEKVIQQYTILQQQRGERFWKNYAYRLFLFQKLLALGKGANC